MCEINYSDLNRYAKQLANLTPEKEELVLAFGPQVIERLVEITDRFYDILLGVPEAKSFLEGRTPLLKKTHIAWLETLFSGPYDESYAAFMYKVGATHVRVNLPVEFMSGGSTLIAESLRELVRSIGTGDGNQCDCRLLSSIDAVLGYSLIVMQKSYQSSMEEQLNKFLKITGISRPLYNNMAKAYKG